MESKVVPPRILAIMAIFNLLPCSLGATDFCLEPLGMKRTIILDEQITESSIFNNYLIRKGFNARLDNYHCWCPTHGSTLSQQWVKVDLRYPMSIRGITIQGDRGYPPNYIKKFKLRYSTDGTSYLYKTADADGSAEEFTGATGQDQTIHRMFNTRPFAARYVEFRPTAFNGNDACVRFELYGCAYVCNQGLGIEYGSALPSGFIMTSSSNQNGNAATSARLNAASSCWCALTNDGNQYLQIDFGKSLTVTGLAIQGNPTADSWVKDFYFDYGMSSGSLVTYQEYGTNKLFVGNVDRSTKVVNWFKVRLFARYVRIKPNTWNGDICMRIEIIGCNSEFVYEIGAENRALGNGRFSASGHTGYWIHGRYVAHDGRLNNDRPWGIASADSTDPWLKVDLGRVMLVNGISIQGDGTWGPNNFPDYKLQYSFEATPAAGDLIKIKEESTSLEKVFAGNTNNAGVKFNLLANPISTKHVRFRKNTTVNNDYTLRVEIYGRPQTCATSFGMEAGSQSTYNPTVQVSSGSIPVEKSKLNSPTAWCAGVDNVNQFFEYEFGGIRKISGFAIQGHPVDLKWVKTFNVEHKQLQSEGFTTYQESGTNKAFVGCTSRNLIVYHWFSSNLRVRYLRIKPLTWNTNICLRMNAYGCPSDDCFNKLGISSNAIGNAAISSSSHASSREGHKGRLNMESVWEANESGVSKPWIQVCLSSVHKVTSIVVQGPGSFDNLAKVTEFSLSFGTSSLGSFQDYSIDSTVKKFAVSIGRYTSSQIDLPFAIVSKCIRLQVESKSPTNQNVGLRWELLGCTTTPQISSLTITPASPSGAKNSNIVLSCNVNALPGADVTWKKGAIILSNGGIYEVGSTTYSTGSSQVTKSLKITATVSTVVTSFQCSVTAPSQGLAECKQSYECSAVIGGVSSTTQSSTTEVKVTGLQAKPSKPTGLLPLPSSLTTSSFSVTWTAATPADFEIIDYKAVIKKKSDNTVVRTIASIASTATSFSGLTTFTTYIVEISAQSSLNVFSDAATLEITTEQGVPTAPLSLSATAVSSTSIQLSWNRPSTLNGILHDYKVRYKLLSDSNFGTPISAGTQLTYNAIGLKPFTDYELQVQATTKGGVNEGPWSSSISSKTLEGASTAPLNLSATAISATSIRLTWNQPTSFSGILHEYKVRYKLASDTTYGSPFGTGKQLNYIVNNLKPYSNYELQVHASTKGGNISGIWSSTAESRTLEGLPTAPLSLSATAVSSTSIQLSWNRPSTLNGILHDYKIRYNLLSDSSFGSPVSAGTQLTYNAIGLKPFTDYKLQVQATTKGGVNEGPWSSSISSKTLEGASTAPLNVSATAVSETSIQLTWNHPVSFNGILYDYKIRYKLSSDSNFGSPISAGTLMVFIVNGVKTFVDYELQVQATTKGGLIPGTWSRYVSCRTQGAANAPRNVSATAISVTSIKLTWIEPISLNGFLHDYKVRYKPATDSSYRNPISASGHTLFIFSTLRPFTDYDFQVSASTGGGTILGNWSLVVQASTKPGVVPKPSLKVNSPVADEGIKVVLENASSNFDASLYRLFFMDGNTTECSKALLHSVIDRIHPSRLPLTLEFKPGVKTVHGTSLEMGTLGNYTLCYQALLEYRSQSYSSDFTTANIERNTLEKMDPVLVQSDTGAILFNIQLAKGPANTKSYNIIVMEGSKSSKSPGEFIPTELGPYDESTYRPGTPYVAAVLSSYTSKFPIGDGKEYELSSRRKRSVDRVVYKNIPLKANTEYFVFQRAYISEEVFFSTPWLGPLMIKSGESEAPPDTGSLTTNTIISTSIAALLFIVNIILFVVIHRSRRQPKHFATRKGGNDFLPMQNIMGQNSIASNQGYNREENPHAANNLVAETTADTIYQEINDEKKAYEELHRREKEAAYQEIVKNPNSSYPVASTSLKKPLPSSPDKGYSTASAGLIGINRHKNRRWSLVADTSPAGGARSSFIADDESNAHEENIRQIHFRAVLCSGVLLRTLRHGVLKKCANRLQHFEYKDDENRVVLQQQLYDNVSSSDYINAIYVEGNNHKHEYIATQHPLQDTISDFWRMIYQEGVQTIVMLNQMKENTMTLPAFWPSVGKRACYGEMFVRTHLESSSEESIEIKLAVMHGNSDKKAHEVKIFRFEEWPDKSLPKDTSNLLKLIKKIDDLKQQESQQKPVVIMCRDGGNRTGAFLSILINLNRFKATQTIDAFGTAQKLRSIRPQFMENMDAYEFCYNVSRSFIDSCYDKL